MAASIRVLVVDDDFDTREVLALLLEHAGCAVTAAGSGEEAFDVLAREDPDVILLDLWLPGIDGTELLLRLRRDPERRATPVVLVTAAPVPPAARLAADAIVPKPFEVDRLLEIVRGLASRRHGERPAGPTAP